MRESTATVFASACSGKTSFETGESKRNSARKTTGAATRNGQERPHGLRAQVEERARRAEQSRRHERGEPVERVALRQRLQDDHGDEPGDEDEVERPRRRGADEPDGELERDEGERRKDDERKREEDDVTARRAAHGEERRVLAEDVEERLRKRERAERGEVGAAAGNRG